MDAGERADLEAAVQIRLPLALAWFDTDEERDAYLGSVREKLGINIDVAVPAKDHWDTLRRRPEGSEMPPRLWESIVPTSDEAQLARRPLAVSVDDNIDLFGKIKKDATEPQFS